MKNIVSFLLSILLFLGGCSSNNEKIKIIILNTGKSDCILIKIYDKSVLIDTGLDENGEEILKKLNNEKISTLDYLILTHMDKDHIGGADKIINNIKVDNLITADYEKDSKQYRQYIKSIEKNNISPVKLKENMEINIDDVKINIYPAEKDYYKKSNDYSIITDISYGKYSFLFAGDAEDERLSEFIYNNNKKYTFVKMPHHGRYDRLTEKFIKNISPQYAVITCSADENADERTINSLNKENSKIYFTYNGEVDIKCSENKISVLQQ